MLSHYQLSFRRIRKLCRIELVAKLCLLYTTFEIKIEKKKQHTQTYSFFHVSDYDAIMYKHNGCRSSYVLDGIIIIGHYKLIAYVATVS